MTPPYHLERRVLGVVDDATVGQYHGDTPVADPERHHELRLKFPQSQLWLAKLAVTMPNPISGLSQPVRVSEFVQRHIGQTDRPNWRNTTIVPTRYNSSSPSTLERHRCLPCAPRTSEDGLPERWLVITSLPRLVATATSAGSSFEVMSQND